MKLHRSSRRFFGRGLWLAALPLLLVAGCSSGGEAPKAADGSPTAEKIKLAFVTNNASDFWTIARKGVEKAVADLGDVEADFRMPSDGTAAGQRAIVDDLITKGVKGIAISPVDPANQTDMINSAAEKAMVATQDSDAPESNRAFYVGTDNVAAGVQAGEQILAALPEGGKIVAFVGSIDAQNAKERLQGIRKALEGSNVELLDVRTDNADHAKAKTNAADILVRYPDISALVGIWSYNGPAILSAVTDAGKVGKTKIICFDEEDATLEGVKSGAISATIVQQPYEFGYQAITMMAKAIKGDTSVIPENKLAIVPTLVITADKVDEFKANLDKLRGRA